MVISVVSLVATLFLGGWAIWLTRQQGYIVDRLDQLQAALAEVQLREKITVIRQRAERFRLPLKDEEKYSPDEAVTLIGDCDAALPLFAYAGDETRQNYINAVCEAATSVTMGYVHDSHTHLQDLQSCLSKHISELERNSQVAAARQLSRCVDSVVLHLKP